MQLHPYLENAVGQICPDRLRALLLWCASGVNSIESESSKLQAYLDEISKADINTCYDLLDSLELNELVHFSLINEFGPRFAQRKCFHTIVESISYRLTNRYNT